MGLGCRNVSRVHLSQSRPSPRRLEKGCGNVAVRGRSIQRRRVYRLLGRRASNQPAQSLEISFIERIHLNDSGRSALRLRRLEQHRQTAESAIVDDAAERLESEAALTDVL